MSEKFKKELTMGEIQTEIDKLEDFFKQIPEELEAETAINIIFHTILWGSYDLYHGMGIIEEAKIRFRKILTDEEKSRDEEE